MKKPYLKAVGMLAACIRPDDWGSCDAASAPGVTKANFDPIEKGMHLPEVEEKQSWALNEATE